MCKDAQQAISKFLYTKRKLKMKRTADVVIIGGGIIGCTIASALRKRGISVLVVEQGMIGAQASSAASGMLAPLKPFARPEDTYTQLLLKSLERFPLELFATTFKDGHPCLTQRKRL